MKRTQSPDREVRLRQVHNPATDEPRQDFGESCCHLIVLLELPGRDSNPQPRGYEPRELPLLHPANGGFIGN